MTAVSLRSPQSENERPGFVASQTRKAQSVIAWSGLFFVPLQSVCTFFTAVSGLRLIIGSGANSEAIGMDAIMVQDESVGFVQGTAFRSGNHCALRALVSQIQTELSGLGPNDGGTRNCAEHTTILRWVQRFVPEFEKRWSQYSQPVGR